MQPEQLPERLSVTPIIRSLAAFTARLVSISSFVNRAALGHPTPDLKFVSADRVPPRSKREAISGLWDGRNRQTVYRICDVNGRSGARPLAPYRLVLCASPHYIASHPPISTPKDLMTHECLVFAHTDLRTQWTFKGPGGLIEVPVRGRFIADHGEALLSAAIAGHGVMLQPHELVSDALKAGSLVELLPQYMIPTRSLNLLYAQDRRMTPKLRSFVDFAVARFGSE